MAQFVILKVGGSVLTNKKIKYSLNNEALNMFASSFSSVWPELQGRCVLVIGGGSIGNTIPQHYKIDNPDQPYRKLDLFRMTTGMFRWASIVTELLSQYGISAYPFQLSALLNGMTGTAYLNPIKLALESGLLPVLTGDLILTNASSFKIFSSDLVPELLLGEFSVSKVIIQTDVPGLLVNVDDHNSLITSVNSSNVDLALEVACSSNSPDITGGMKLKVEAMLSLAQKGVRGVICGSNMTLLQEALVSDNLPGTVFEPWPNQLLHNSSLTSDVISPSWR